jgi:Skp family chaperone for outer membrane proteins
MKDKLLPWFLLFCALGLSGTAAYYSVVGLSVVFVGVALPVIIMGGFLEISKLAIATYLHDKWKETYGVLKIYLTLALITLSLITSLGIYGLLSTGFSTNIAKLEIGQKEVKNIEVKKQRFEEIKNEYQKEKQTLDKDISKLRNALSTNTTTQSVDRQTGQVVTRANNANRKSFETQLQLAIENRDKMSGKVDALNDSITALDIQILNMESEEISGNELGTIKYISEMTGWSVKKTANIFILILIFVFDPLAITLVIATNQAFKNNRKEEDDNSLKQEEDSPKEILKVEKNVVFKENNSPKKEELTHELTHELPHELPHQIEEVNVPESLLSINDTWEWIPEETEPLFEDVIEDVTEDVTEDGMEEIMEPQVEENKPEPQRELRRLSYGNRNGNGSGLRINRF